MSSPDKIIANYLLQIKAIKLQPANHFTWSSGWFSPIYCDNRRTLSFPEIRTYIATQFVNIIQKKYKKVTTIAGVATGAIAHGALVADKLNLPFVYVRSSQKSHGLENLVEGHLEKDSQVVVIEDLISTGKSSLKAVEAIRNAGSEVVGLGAIFTYNFDIASEHFKTASCDYFTLSDYHVLIEMAVESGYISGEDTETLKQWRKDPANWKK